VTTRKRVRVIKKIREVEGGWRFVSMKKIGARYAWDNRPGHFFIEWWEGRKRRRELAGQTPSEAMEAQRRKRNELVGEALVGGKKAPPEPSEGSATPLTDAIQMFLQHVRVHSPDKPLRGRTSTITRPGEAGSAASSTRTGRSRHERSIMKSPSSGPSSISSFANGTCRS
jgi:hypothetical protein